MLPAILWSTAPFSVFATSTVISSILSLLSLSGQIPFCGSSLLQLQGIIHLTTVGKALWVFCHLDPEKTLVASHFPWTRAGHMSSPSCRKPGNCAGACGVSDPFADERSETQRGRWEGTKSRTGRWPSWDGSQASRPAVPTVLEEAGVG